MVDIHSHILPNVDDGAKSWEIAVEMCRMAAQDGIEHMVATPHANDKYAYDREKLSETLQELREKVAGAPQLSLGCDFHFSYENIQDALAHPERYTIDATDYFLVEFSNFGIPPSTEGSLAHFLQLGMTPIITHPERNPLLQQSPERILNWAKMGCVIQVTANAFTGRWGKTTQKVAEKLLKDKAVHVLATDAHGVEDRTPILSEGRDVVARLASEEIAEALVDDNPRAIVSGDPLPYFPQIR